VNTFGADAGAGAPAVASGAPRQNGSSNRSHTRSTTPMPSSEIARCWRSGSGGSNAIVSVLSTPSGAVTTTRSARSDSPVSRRRLTRSSRSTMSVTALAPAMSSPSESSWMSERQPSTTRAVGGHARSGSTSSAETCVGAAPVAGSTPVESACTSQSSGLAPEASGSVESGAMPDRVSAAASETSDGCCTAHACAARIASQPVGGTPASASPSTVRTPTTGSNGSVVTDASPSTPRIEAPSETKGLPSSTGIGKSLSATVRRRPPSRSDASITTTSKPASVSLRAAASPAMPAPTTAMRSPGSARSAITRAARRPSP
jgi:hypothetical protein